MTKRALTSFLLLPVLCALAPISMAAQVSYSVDFAVDYILEVRDSRLQLGDIYSGSFTVDDSILSQDGINKAGNVSAFVITMEDVTWNMGLRFPLSEFSNFRGPGGFGTTPGFDVAGGQITNLRGGIAGAADYPWVDFSTDARIPFISDPNPACPTGYNYCGNSPNSYWSVNPLGNFGGSMNIHQVAAPVPEPEAYAMVLLGAVMVAVRFATRGGFFRRHIAVGVASGSCTLVNG